MQNIDLTSHNKLFEEPINQSYEPYHNTLAELSPEAMVIIIEGKLVYLNRAAILLFGASQAEELLGRPILDFIHSDYREAVTTRIHQSTRQQHLTGLVEAKFLRLDGQPILIEAFGAPIIFQGQSACKVFIRDITLHKQVAEDLNLARKQLTNLLDSLDQAYWSADMLKFKMLFISPACEKVYGFSQQAFLDNPMLWKELIHPDDLGDIEKADTFLYRGHSVNSEYRIIHPDSQIHWVEVKIKPVMNAQGKLIRLDGITTDITRRKEAEFALKARVSQQALVAEIGQLALSGCSLQTLMDEAAARLAITLGVEYCKILELQPCGEKLLLRAGAGWQKGLVGHAIVSAGTESLAGYTLLQNEPVIMPDLRQENRFKGLPLLVAHGVISGMSVIIPGRSKSQPYGVLGAHTSQRRDFTRDDINCLMAIANVLANAIENKRVNDQLRQSEARFALFMQNLPGFALIKNGEDQHLYANETWERIFNLRPSEWPGKRAEQLMPAELVAELKRDEQHVFEDHQVVETIQVIPQSDGNHHYLVNKFPILEGPEGSVLLGEIGVEVTQRHLAEQRLGLQHSITQLLAEANSLETAAPLILRTIGEQVGWQLGNFWYIDKSNSKNLLRWGGSWHEACPEIAEFVRQTRQYTFSPGSGLPGRVWQSQAPMWISDISGDDNLPRRELAIKNKLYAAFAFPIKVGVEILGVIEFFSQELRPPDKALLQLFSGLGNQIGQYIERKRAEAELRTSEERFRQLAENIQEVFWISDPQFQRIDYISPAYEALWGQTCQSLYADPMSFMQAVLPQDQAMVLEAVEKMKQGVFDVEFRIRQPNQSIHWIHSRAFPIKNEAGIIYRMAGIAEDITQIKCAEEEIRNALKKEKELGELKSRFVSTTSHEFRTPLTAILSSVELLEFYNDRMNADKKAQIFQRIKQSICNFTHLLDEILLYGKAEAGKIEFIQVPIDLAAFCKGLLEEIKPLLTEAHSIVLNLSPEVSEASPAAVEGDEKLLRQILTNLLSNAIKYSPKGGEIEFKIECSAQEIVFQIKDQGIGIPAADLPHLFEPFHRSGNVGPIPGTGLGLAIIKNCVDAYGGNIQVNSQEGQGSTFTIILPRNTGGQSAGA